MEMGDYILGEISKEVDPKESELLEVGIGKGKFGNLISGEFKAYSGIDKNEENVKIATSNLGKESNVVYKVGNALDIPFEKKFDVIFYSFSWHFLEDFEKGLSEAERLLDKEGIIVILEPSENTTEWRDPVLRKDSDKFNEEIYSRKIKKLGVAHKFIRSQNKFKVKENYDKEIKNYLFILKK